MTQIERKNRSAEEYTVSTTKAAKTTGKSIPTMIRKAREGKIDYVLRGDSSRPQFWFHPDDVEELRIKYQVGYRPVAAT